MNRTHNAKLSQNARNLRKYMTKEERKLWYEFLRALPIMVHRQKVMGRYIVDFYVAEAKLIIELDGSQHYGPAGMTSDEERDAYLASLGFTVLRYANSDIHTNFQAVCQDIFDRLSPLLEERVSRPKP